MKVKILILSCLMVLVSSAVIKDENKESLMPKDIRTYKTLSDVQRREKNSIDKQLGVEEEDLTDSQRSAREAKQEEQQEVKTVEENKVKKESKTKKAKVAPKDFKLPVSGGSQNRRFKKSTPKEYCVQAPCGNTVCGSLISVKGDGASLADGIDISNMFQPVVTRVPVFYEFEDIWPYGRTTGAAPGFQFGNQYIPTLDTAGYQPFTLAPTFPVHQPTRVPSYQSLLQLSMNQQDSKPIAMLCTPGFGGAYSCHQDPSVVLRNETGFDFRYEQGNEYYGSDDYDSMMRAAIDEQMRIAEAQKMKVIENQMRAAAVRQMGGIYGHSPYYSQGMYQQQQGGYYSSPFYRSNDVPTTSNNDDCLMKMINIAMKLGLFPNQNTARSQMEDEDDDFYEESIEDEDNDVTTQSSVKVTRNVNSNFDDVTVKMNDDKKPAQTVEPTREQMFKENEKQFYDRMKQYWKDV